MSVAGYYGIVWASGIGKFVGVGAGKSPAGTATVIRSSDALNWTEAATGFSIQLNAVGWSADLGLLVALRNSVQDNMLTSPDAVNWTSHGFPFGSLSDAWLPTGVTWSPSVGKFVAVASQGVYQPTDVVKSHIAYSANGTAWTPVTTPNEPYYDVIWSPELNLYIIAGNGKARTSPDAVTWTDRTTPAKTWRSVVWSALLNLAVLVGDNGAIATSPDGITWTDRTANTPDALANWSGIVWSPELGSFVAVAGAGNSPVFQSMRSYNGVDWFGRVTPAAEQWARVAWSPTLNSFAAVASSAGVKQVMSCLSLP